MKVSQWAEIRRLVEVEKLSHRAVALSLRCCFRTVAKALSMDHPPDEKRSAPRGSLLDPYKPKIDALLARYPQLSAACVMEEIRRGPDGYQGKLTLVRIYIRKVRPRRGRVYQEVEYEPGQAMQIDWGHCGQIRIGSTQRKVSVFVAVLCYSRLCYIEFTLSQRKAEFYRAIVNALTFFGGSPRRIIFDNLKAAVLNGSGRSACLHPEFLALCGHFCLEPIACERRDPESKGTVEAGVRYVKRNALAGREDELVCWDDYQQLAVTWRDDVANVRLHHTTRQRPVDRFVHESHVLRPLPGFDFDTDEVVPAIVSSHARVHFDGNRYSVPPKLQNANVFIRANATQIRVIAAGEVAASHVRSYDRNQLINLPEHRLEALKLRSRVRAHDIEDAFDSLGDEARKFHLELRRQPVKTTVHLRRLLNLVHLYGRQDVVAAIARANQWQTFDAAYVETILLQDRRRRELPSPTQVRPRREELLEETDLEEPDPADYDRLIDMINRLTTAQINGTLELALKTYLKPSLLLLDELGYLPIDKRGADLLFQVVAARYESGSIVITTNRPFRDWGRIFDVDNTLATAMIDRLMHHGEAMVIQGSSFRTKGENPDDTKGENPLQVVTSSVRSRLRQPWPRPDVQ